MKKIWTIAALLIGLASCQKESTIEPTIEGYWYDRLDKASISEYISLKDSVHIIKSLTNGNVYRGRVYLLPLGKIWIMNHKTEYKFNRTTLEYDRTVLFRK